MFCKKDMIANKMSFQNIYRLHAFWLGSVVLSRSKIEQKSEACSNKSEEVQITKFYQNFGFPSFDQLAFHEKTYSKINKPMK